MPEDLNVVDAFGGKALGDRFAIYIPNRDRDGMIVEQKAWIERALRLLSDVGGGATAMPPVTGAWLNPDSNELIIEEPVVVYTYVDPDVFEQEIERLRDFVREIGRETNQGSMAVEYGNTFFYVENF
jgi:hypothetical protein